MDEIAHLRLTTPDEQKAKNREAVLRGLFERAFFAREFRSG